MRAEISYVRGEEFVVRGIAEPVRPVIDAVPARPCSDAGVLQQGIKPRKVKKGKGYVRS